MNICIISNFSGLNDEGMRNIAENTEKLISREHVVLHVHLNHVATFHFWDAVIHFKPDLIHYLPGPSIRSLILVRVLHQLTGARTIISAPRPTFGKRSAWLVRLLKPDVVIAYDTITRDLFIRSGCHTRVVPAGVDLDRFIPVDIKERNQLRRKYKLDENKYYLLHVGPLVKGRGLELLAQMVNTDNNQVIIVASTSIPANNKLKKELEQNGCIIWHCYIAEIENVYQMADCYVFPVPIGSNRAILQPLSVMEAMSCNLPVISTRFGGLPDLIDDGAGFVWFHNANELKRGITQVKNFNNTCTREKIKLYSWDNVVNQLCAVYDETVKCTIAR